jgi:hypothetical protein
MSLDCPRPPLAQRAHRGPGGKCRKHRDARRLQCPQGQHDNLACLPRARPRQSCDRRTPSTWHGSCPPRRPACRMVPPAPDARASGPIAAHSNRVSGDCGLRCRETGFPGQRKMRPIRRPNTDQRSQRPSGRTRSPPIRGLCKHSQEFSATAGLRGGPGRTRNSNQTIMSGRPGSRLLAFSILMDEPECGALVGPGKAECLGTGAGWLGGAAGGLPQWPRQCQVRDG